MYCGGYGVIENAKKRERGLWIEEINKVFNYYGIGEALWNYKGFFYKFKKNITIIGNNAGFFCGLIDISRQNGTISRWCCINVIPIKKTSVFMV